MAGAGHGQATQAPRGVKIPHDPAHYGRALAVQAEESEVMNAAAGSTPASLTSRKAKRKTAPVERDGQSRKEIVKNLMNNRITEPGKKSSVLKQVKILEGIVDSLESAGVYVINAQAATTRDSYVFFHYADDAFQQWAAENELDVIVEPHESDTGTGLKWWIGTHINGIAVHSYMSDADKEAWDHANLGD